ncbi:hypothetical protein [Micromonospora sp. NPDC004704]
MSFEKGVSDDMFYALRGMTYQVTGMITVTRSANGGYSTSGGYKVTAYKAWNFDKNEDLLGVPFRGPANAAGFGGAREFAVISESNYHTW